MDRHSEDAPLGFMFFWDESEWSNADKLSEEYRLALAAWNSGAECAREYHDKVLRTKAQVVELEAQLAEVRVAMREIFEVWAGADGFVPETAPEAYQQRLIEKMSSIAADHLNPTTESPNTPPEPPQ